jgi:hypothetical protein
MSLTMSPGADALAFGVAEITGKAVEGASARP